MISKDQKMILKEQKMIFKDQKMIFKDQKMIFKAYYLCASSTKNKSFPKWICRWKSFLQRIN